MVLIADEDALNLNNQQQELVVSVTIIGAMATAAVSGVLNDRYGRKPVIMASSVVFVLGAIVMAVSRNYEELLVGRLIVGLGVGASSMSVPVYVSEAAPAPIRGFLVTCVNVAITSGQFISSLVDGGFSEVHDGWRYMLGLAAVPAFIQLVGFLFLPESPRWLVKKAKIEQATVALAKLRGPEYDVDEEIRDVQESLTIEENSSGQVDLWSLLTQPHVRRALWVGCALQAAQQLSGINTVMYYSATILKLAGFTDNTTAIWLACVVSFMNMVGSSIGLYLVERTGRRRLTLTSLFAVAVALAWIAVSFYVAKVESEDVHGVGSCNHNNCFDCVTDNDCGFCSNVLGEGFHGSACIRGDEDDPNDEGMCASKDYDFYECPSGAWRGWMIFISFCAYLLVFAPGMGTMPWTINSEIYPLNVRGVANSVATSVNWICNLIVSITFLTLTEALTRHGAFFLYSGVAMSFFVFLYLRLPETSGKSLEDITTLFTDRPSDDVSPSASLLNRRDRAANR